MLTFNLAAEAAQEGSGNPVLNIAVFGAFLVITMWVVLRAGKTTKKASDFYTGGGTFSGARTVWPFPATTFLPRPSSVSSARSLSTDMTDSCILSASSWPGWWR